MHPFHVLDKVILRTPLEPCPYERITMTSLYDELPVVYGTGEELVDGSTDWRSAKLKSEAVAESFNESTTIKRFDRMMDCGALLKFAVDKAGTKRLINANFCKDRMCPSCQKRRSLMIFHQVKNVCEAIQSDFPTYRYLLLTLTVPNVKAEQLNKEISHINRSWDRLTKRAFFKSSIKGWFRALEVTHNEKRDDYHPHIHVVLCVPAGYFKKNYITRDQWLAYWQEATRYPEITQVDIRSVRESKKRPERSPIASVAAEVGKYATKPSNYVSKQPNGDFKAKHKVVRELAAGIARKRLVAFGGIMKGYHAKLQQDDVESESVDLVNITGESDLIDAVMVQVFHWNIGLRIYIN